MAKPNEKIEVDLTNCDREPIHILGKVQDFGCLLAVSADWIVTHASENCADILGHAPDALLGNRLANVLPAQTIHDLRTKMQILNYQQSNARVFGYPVFADERLFDICIHGSGRNYVFEFEQKDGATKPQGDSGTVQALISRVQRHTDVDKMAKEAARGLKLLAGFDRVMVYRFEEDDSGTVIAEAKEPGQEAFLGLRYPASDIPKQARELYLRSLLRIISDVNGPTYKILPEFDPNGEPLDLSLAVTRAVSPIHLEYLRNMGVESSMSVSIISQGKLWGLFACHNDSPHYISFEDRTAIEFFSQLFNYELTQVEMTSHLQSVDRAKVLHDRMMSQLSGGQSIFETFEGCMEEIREVIPFDGAAVYSDGKYRTVGSAPTEEEFVGLARFLNTTPTAQVYASDNILGRYPKGESFLDRAAGLLALPISRTPRDYLVLFRREIAKSVSWAGNPQKPVTPGPNGLRLTPRKSFEAWQEVVRGHSAPWTDLEKRAADALRVTLLEVVLKLSDESNSLRKQAQDQQELLIAELNHRVRNILNLIRGLVSQGSDEVKSVADFRNVLDNRIHALARAHDQLTRSEWSWVSLRELIETEMTAYLSSNMSRVKVTGADVDLSPTAFTTVALVIHELVTNSAKYGALTDRSGTISIGLDLRPDGTLLIAWREMNGPPVQAPKRQGFGTTIIERSIPFELKGTANVRFKVTGLEADFSLPSTHVRKSVAPAKTATAPGVLVEVPPVNLSGRAVILEDNMIIALDAADILGELGASEVRTASNVADGLLLLDEGDVNFALLDVNLGEEQSFPMIEECLERGIPTILATGYGDNQELVSRFPNVVILKKPYTIEHLRSALPRVMGL